MLVSAIFLWRRIYRELPLFFIYIVSAWTIGLLRYIAFNIGSRSYFYVYWISELAGAVTVSLALYEVFLRRLFIRFYKIRFYRNLFPTIAVVILILTIVTALQAHDKRAAFMSASRGFDFARTSVLVFFVGLMAVMGREWKRYDFGIALGFGLQASAALLNAAMRIQGHYNSSIPAAIEIAAYDVACIIWVITFWKPEKSQSGPPGGSVETLYQAQKWEETLKSFLLPGKHLR